MVNYPTFRFLAFTIRVLEDKYESFNYPLVRKVHRSYPIQDPMLSIHSPSYINLYFETHKKKQMLP